MLYSHIIRKNIIYQFDLNICLMIETYFESNEDIHVLGFN